MAATAFERRYLAHKPRHNHDWSYLVIGMLLVGCILGTIINAALPGSYEKAHAAEIAASYPKTNKEACIQARDYDMLIKDVGVARFVRYCKSLGVSI